MTCNSPIPKKSPIPKIYPGTLQDKNKPLKPSTWWFPAFKALKIVVMLKLVQIHYESVTLPGS